ncbi:MAG: hypothetical protein EPO64_07155 [Nitrospirae bacterium]|nr:MAG: hypothetical protein EPO64_07155 [Nitrospirota bacterium]
MVVTSGRRWFIFAFLIPFLLVPPDSADPAPTADPKRLPSLCAIHHPSDARVEWDCRRLQKGETLEGLFGDRWKDAARFNRVDRRHAYPDVALKVPRLIEEIADFTPMPAEYAPAEAEAKFILVDLSEQFLGAYEYGRLVFSSPIATGEMGNETPNGEFRIAAVHREHHSSLYTIEGMDIPYPMTYALRFFINREGVSFWMHGRDLPGVPASHGCIGLYDEAMQKEYYGAPKDPVLDDAKRLYDWVVGSLPDDGRLLDLKERPKVLIVGQAPSTGQLLR